MIDPSPNPNHGGIHDPTDRPDTRKREYNTVNKAFLIERGWTRTSIKRILGEPDRRLPMVQFRKDRPECRYSMDRVMAAENAGSVRFREAGDRFMPSIQAPEDLAEAMVSAKSARERRRILRKWAERQDMISTDAPAYSRRLQWDNVVSIFVVQKKS